jgi:hypothetical protein
MRKLLISTVLAGCLAASLASAQEAAAPQTTPTAPATTATPPVTPAALPNPDDVMVCRYEKVTGSLFTSRICHTQRQWKQREQNAHDLLEKSDQEGAGQARGS